MLRQVRVPFAVAGILGLLLATPVGAFVTAGEFGVSPSGSATYSIPIHVPPGIAGVEPVLALHYDSQGGNGLLGVGWSLSGQSAVTRCPHTPTQDAARRGVKFDAQDRYCLDGQRLVAIDGTYGADGTEYRTEIEGFSRIVSHGQSATGPVSFTVWTKSGLVMHYGASADSRIEAQGKSAVAAWALHKVVDTLGNFLTWSYFKDSTQGTWHPTRIDYTGNAAAGVSPASSVIFAYTTRPDHTLAYLEGSAFGGVALLESIRTYVGTTLVTEYRLTHDVGQATARSRLTSVALCSGADDTCHAPIVIGYQDMPAGVFAAPISTPMDYEHSDWKKAILEDVNGDGLADWIYRGSENIHVRLSNGDGSFTPRIITPIGQSYKDFAHAQLADVNGNGLNDWVWNGNTNIFLKFSNGDGTFAPLIVTPVGGSSSNFTKALMLDVDGDGRADWVFRGNENIHVALSNGDGTFSPRIVTPIGLTSDYFMGAQFADINGDGLADYVVPGSQYIYFKLSNGDGTFGPLVTAPLGMNSSSLREALFVDVNGDGLADWVFRGSANVFVRLSRGDGTFTDSVASPIGQSSDHYKQAQFADVNGDGLTDWVNAGASRISVMLAKGDGTFGPRILAPLGMDHSWLRDSLIVDVDGDGLADWVHPGSVGLVARLLDGVMPDLATSFSQEAGPTVEITYLPLTREAVYAKGDDAAYPVQDIQAPLYVVRSVRHGDGLGDWLTTEYRHGGLKTELGTGRGLLGFAWSESSQLDTGLVSRTEYHQDFPFVGLAHEQTTSLAGAGNGGVLSRATHEYQCTDFDTVAGCQPAPGRRYLPFNTRVEEFSWDLDGTALPATRTDTVLDCAATSTACFGNALQVTVTTLNPDGSPSGYARITTNTFYDDPAQWILGRLIRATVQNTMP